MLTGITEVTQNASKAGSALRMLSMRLRGTSKEELEALGVDTEGLIEVTAKLQKSIYDMSGVDITDSMGQIRSTFDIMRDIAAVWQDLSPNKQANLLETIAGKNRASDVAALLNNWNQVEAAFEAATNASGTASKENEKYMDSLEGHLKRLTASWQTLANTVLDSDFLKGMVDTGTAFLNVLNSIVDKVGTLPTLIGGITTALSAVKGVGELIKQFHWPIILGNEYAHEAA